MEENEIEAPQVKPVVDWRGTRILPGSTVIYPGRQGSSLWVTEGTVESVAFRPARFSQGSTPFLRVCPTRTTSYRGTKNLVVLTNVGMVTVIG